MPEGGEGYQAAAADLFVGHFNGLKDNVPDHLRPAAESRIQELAISLGGQAEKRAASEARALSRHTLNEGIGMVEAEAVRNPQAATGLIAKAHQMIDTNPDLSPQERREMKGQIANGITETSEIARVSSDPIARAAYAGADPLDLIREFEGFREGAYWDVNHYRTGYGSDTVTRADGSTEIVTKDTVVSRADAERDLARRVSAFQAQAAKEVGNDAWASLPPNAQAALTSIAYNYGEVPKRLRAAARSGDVEALASAVEGLAGDNDGVNAERRRKEANIIRGGNAALSAASYQRVQGAAMKVLAADRKARDAENAMASAQLGVRVSAGEATEADIDGALAEGVISPSRWESLREQRISMQKAGAADAATLDDFMAKLQDGGRLNPMAADDRKGANLLDDALVARAEQSGQDPMEARIEVLPQTGVAPKGLIEDLRGGMNEGDPSAFDQAYRALQSAPNAFDGVPNGADVKKRVAAFQSYVDAGMSAEIAARRANPSSEEAMVHKAAEPQIREELKDADISVILDEFDSWMPFDAVDMSPHNSALAMRDYEVLYRAARQDGMDAATAKSHAVKQLTNPQSGLYGVTQFGSGTARTPFTTRGQGQGRKFSFSERIVRLPPERFYPVIDGGHDYIRKDIQSSLKALDDFEDGSWALMPEPGETDAAAKAIASGQGVQLPGYRIAYVDKSGNMQYAHWYMTQEELQPLLSRETEKNRERAGQAAIVAEGLRAQDPGRVSIRPRGENPLLATGGFN